MGNICRSPAAECFFRTAAEEAGVSNQFHIESAGTGGWHIGHEPDSRMRAAAEKKSLQISGAARQITRSDISSFDWIFCMDYDNFEGVRSLGGDQEHVHLLLPFVGNQDVEEVPDPYYGGEDGFDQVVDLINQSTRQLVDILSE
jgi:protein-tyrosine phosphatase